MAQVTYPGVYVEEVSSGVRPLAAASTSIAAFVGVAEKGPVSQAVKVFSFTEYQNVYGGFLAHSFLSHAVFQFFNNGGAQCYVIRVAGAGHETSTITLKDRSEVGQNSLTIAASTPGAWGNQLGIAIADGTNDPGNEFNLSVHHQDDAAPLETLSNLSMTPGTSNFVETITASSSYIRATVDLGNTSAVSGVGVSRGSKPPLSLEGTGRTRFRINLNQDGFHEVELQGALDTATEIATAIQDVVSGLTSNNNANQAAFSGFTCQVENDVLVLRSGSAGPGSSVVVAPAANSGEDASGLLGLGLLSGGIESLGRAVTRPRNNPVGTPPDNLYLVGDHTAPTDEVAAVQAGSDGNAIVSDQPYIASLNALDNKEDVSLIAAPGIGSPAMVGAGMTYCANRSLSDCFFIGDMSQHDDTVEEAKAFRDAITPKNSYGAVYTPWVQMLDPTGQSPEPILVPPCGFVAGLYAQTDAQQGVWKAPAGTGVALSRAVGLATNFTDVHQGNLNPINVNVIRQFAGSGIVLWGARTITSDPEWRYIPVRRMAIFLRVSIYRGIQWAVFEPNDEDLWASLRLNIGSFMTTLFRQGAFQGSTPSQAFFVKVDNETTTQADINNGVVNVLVGFAPLKPAEFVIVKISQAAAQSA